MVKMKLNYYNVNNFGDALNPLIFYKLLPNFFDNEPSTEFFGIGSIIGENMKKFKRKIIFSSGFAYGKAPVIDSSFEMVCVRGPLSAKALKIEKELAITDGAALLREFNFPSLRKDYAFSFMPHFESEKKYPWKTLCAEIGINYVSPTADPMFIIDEILKSKVVVAEAMHFAIVADVLRVPWIAVKAYPGINDFKWHDWTQSLDMVYKPESLASLFEEASLDKKLRQKTANKLPAFVYSAMARSYVGYQDLYLKDATVRKFKKITNVAPQLSKDRDLNVKVGDLLEKLEVIKNRHKKHCYDNA